MSRKHYQEVARIIADEVERTNPEVEPTRALSLETIARRMGDNFNADNPRFDRQRFYFACALSTDGRIER